MKREPENDERTPEVDKKNRKASGDEMETNPEQKDAGGSGKSGGQSGSTSTGGTGSARGTAGTGGTGSTSSSGNIGRGGNPVGAPGGSRPSETQGDERQRMGNKSPDTGENKKT
jgi:hypothetical protein